jgi:large subunit ribosomal protein L22
MKALLTNYHQSPRKVQLVANLIRGKSVSQARALLSFQPQKSSPALLKLLNSAVSNASNVGATADDLFVKTITVNKGAILKRFKPMARGRAAQFHRTMSIVALELGPISAKVSKGKKESKPVAVEKKIAKPRVKKTKSASAKASGETK